MAVLMCGTLMSQLLIFSSTIIMGHLYSPSQFGFYALVVSIAGIIGLILSRSLETFIVPAENKEEAERIFFTSIRLVFKQLSILILFFITTMIALTLVDAITPRSVALFGLSLLLSPLIALYSLSYQLVLRVQKFGVLATRGPLQNSAIGLNQWILNHSSLQSVGLVLGEILGRLIGLLFLFFNVRTILKQRPFKVLRGPFREKLDQPVLVNLISIGFDLAAASALLIFINLRFGDWAAGQLSMAQKIVVLPIVFFGTNLAQYFLSTGSHDRRNGINVSRNDFDSIIWKLLCFGIFIAVTLFLTSTSLLSIFLGSEWMTTGKLIQTLLPIMVISLVWNPMSSFYYVRGLWMEFLKVSAIRLGFIFAGALAANLFKLNLYQAIVLITLSSGVIQLYGLHVLRKNFLAIGG